MNFLQSFSCLFGLMLLCTGSIAQQNLLAKLQGSWKIEGKEQFEHWDILNTSVAKGIAYNTSSQNLQISEYTQLSKKGKNWIYTATVVNQNQGRSIDFIGQEEKDRILFQNKNHDFPKQIIYQFQSADTLLIELSDLAEKKISYHLIRQQLPTKNSDAENPNYDAALVKKLGADDYGMKPYIFVLLTTGDNKTTDKEFISKSFAGHMENISNLVKTDKLIVAGPFMKNNQQYRGLFILNNVRNIEDAKSLMETDPAIKNNLLKANFFNWYGSAALSEYLPASDKIWKKKH